MKIDTFELERRQSLWENTVEYNLTESGIHPFTLEELLDANQIKQLNNIRIGYGQTNGSIGLREAICKLYPTSTQENILVTNGSAEANFISMWSMLEKDDEFVCMLPNYMQTYGLAQSLGAKVKPFYLKEELDWQPDLEDLKSIITKNTKMISICNPNNPTGSILSDSAVKCIIDLAEDADAYIHSDEVYRGAELDGNEIETVYNKYEKVIAVGGLSKAYSLPGLRMGWIVGPEEFASKAWSYHDYTTISPSVLSQQIAEWALQPEMRERILSRNRKLLNENLEFFQDWMDTRKHLFTFVPQEAGAMSFVKYHIDMNSTDLTEKLRKEKSLLLVAGDCYGMDSYLRIGIGSEKEYLEEGLNRFADMLEVLIDT
ncbi:MAG: aminotransferase class I/II-fold pyridoxal phosphate-dependent enzyme [Candidatus Heimdallarchaeota archaeon]|nr:aminotransferase class I/II-fold pyridoxal phosphate-dependent enzyme [Candidatus Heimdallarchaeota archaeon]